MNRGKLKILEVILKNEKISQRKIADTVHYSLGKVNQILNNLMEEGYLDDHYQITKKAKDYCVSCKPNNAIILAAGVGFRMIPINNQTNKALLEVKGEILIERLICQLQEVGIYDITIVVGYMKEQFDYLIDKYNVRIITNMDYASTNSLYSLSYVENRISNTYIVPCDLYFEENPFSKEELYSWYLLGDEISSDSYLRINSVGNLVYTEAEGNHMIGVSYITSYDRNVLIEQINDLIHEGKKDSFYEDALMKKGKCIISYKVISSSQVKEFNTYHDLESFDCMSPALRHEVFTILMDTLEVELSSIKNIRALKTGMTNRSFLFECGDKKYIMRIPGEGTDMLINRHNEGKVYDVIKKLDISDRVLYFNEDNGYKLTEFIEGTRNCDAFNFEEVKKSMAYLKRIHEMKLSVDHEFNIFEKIDYYESLWNGKASMYKDYEKTKRQIYELKNYIDSQPKEYCLCHIDSVPDNFLFFDINGKEQIRLIDWEYASIQDPHVDIAMFVIYAMYERVETEKLIDLYFEGNCDQNTRIKIYCYIACCGLLWSNWCEYKATLGVEFGEYSMKQYRYAKDYYKLVKEMVGEELL